MASTSTKVYWIIIYSDKPKRLYLQLQCLSGAARLETRLLKLLSKCVLVAQSCPTPCDPMDCSPPGSSVHEIFQARILEWAAISFSRWSSQPRDQTQVSRTAGLSPQFLFTPSSLFISNPSAALCLQPGGRCVEIPLSLNYSKLISLS